MKNFPKKTLDKSLKIYYNIYIENKKKELNMKWNKANCYGYATRNNDWLCTYGSYKDEVYQFPDYMVPVKRSEMKLGKVYIAYRFGCDDFHFMRRDEKGHWRHKPGRLKVRDISEKNVFANNWDERYNSKVYLFQDSRY